MNTCQYIIRYCSFHCFNLNHKRYVLRIWNLLSKLLFPHESYQYPLCWISMNNSADASSCLRYIMERSLNGPLWIMIDFRDVITSLIMKEYCLKHRNCFITEFRVSRFLLREMVRPNWFDHMSSERCELLSLAFLSGIWSISQWEQVVTFCSLLPIPNRPASRAVNLLI